LRGSYLYFFYSSAFVFVLVEAASVCHWIRTGAQDYPGRRRLYRGTQYVQAMDFSHRVQIERRDQLGELGESFNRMTGSISQLIEEENKRRRLEDEISIAGRWQTAFPSTLPSVPGVEIEAICKAARSVSGDYYDFIQPQPNAHRIAIADISGKGISAALLMQVCKRRCAARCFQKQRAF